MLLLGVSRVEPLVVVVEDLQWADSETHAVLESLLENLPAARLALVVVCRPEHSPRWAGKTYFTHVRVNPLSPESTQALIDVLLGHDPALGPLKKLLVERTEGNPFFLEESVRALVEGGVLSGEAGAYRLTKDPEAVDLSPSVRAVLADRINRLGDAERRLLQAAAVIGKDVDHALLEAIADLPQDALRLGLAQVRVADLLYEARVFPTPEYTFKHALTHEVAYASLLPERRTALHARVVEAIEAAYTDRLAEQVDRLAHHALRGALWEKAVRYFRQAGTSALSRSAYREAVSCFDHAIEAISHLPESPERLGEAIDLRLELRTPLVAIDDHPRFVERLREAQALVSRTGDRRRHCRALAYMCHTSFLSGDLKRAIVLGEQAAAIASELDDRQLQIAVDYPLGQVYYTAGELERAADLFREIAVITGEPSFTKLVGLEAAGCRAYLALGLGSFGQFPQAFVHAREALEIARSTGRHYDLVVAHAGLGSAHNLKGEFDKAIPVLVRAVELARTSDLAAWHSTALSYLGVAYRSTRPDDAVRVLSESIELDRRRRVMSGHSGRLGNLGYAHFSAGRPAQGLQIVEQALDRARSQGERVYEARVLCMRGDILAGLGRADEAQATYWEGHDLATALGMRPWVAHCQLGLGKLHRRRGQSDAAREHLTSALAMYREMDMRFWPDQAEAELASLG